MSKRKIKNKRKNNNKTKSFSAKKHPPGGRIDISLEKLKSIINKSKHRLLSEDDVLKLEGAVDTLALLTSELELKGASIRRLRNLLFGSSTEKMSNIFGDDEKDSDKKSDKSSDKTADEKKKSDNTKKNKNKKKGHGRNGSDKYTGAQKIEIAHDKLKAKDHCPGCLRGKLYTQKDPATLVRVTGMAPLNAKVYEMERLRCNLCGEVFTAKTPDGLGEEKYDYSAAAMIALLKYGCGMPFNRLERLEKDFGIPLPASTQWDVAHKLATTLAPVYTELIKQAADGNVLHNDDTTAKILNLELPKPDPGAPNKKERTGVYTSGILSTKDDRQIAVFFTGNKHAGENLEHVLKQRNKDLSVPIQMCDAMSVNTTGDFETLLSNCNAHARRKFVEVADIFPEETKHILDVFKQVYKNDDDTKNMTAKERLDYHIKYSKTPLDDLKVWFKKQFEEKKIEPNSALGKAIEYMTRHWNELTLFLSVQGVPLDNNICERAIKKAILHRKNALFFKTQNGACVADLFMSLIHTCELQKVNPFDYMTELAKNEISITENSANWMPWNYKATLAAISIKNKK